MNVDTARSQPIDVSKWTRHHVDDKHPMWWGILGLIAVEVTVVVAFLVSYFYLWLVNLSLDRMGWPPKGTELPPLTYPSINMALLLVCGWSMWYGGIVMQKGQSKKFAALTFLCCAISVVILVLRYLQFLEFDFDWTTHAFGSFVWALTAFHFVHVTSAALGTAVIGFLAWQGYYTQQRWLGVQVDTLYWYFVVATWAPIYFVLYWAPRLF